VCGLGGALLVGMFSVGAMEHRHGLALCRLGGILSAVLSLRVAVQFTAGLLESWCAPQRGKCRCVANETTLHVRVKAKPHRMRFDTHCKYSVSPSKAPLVVKQVL
jgi:hypothetical protein